MMIYLQLYKQRISYCVVLYSLVPHPCTKKDLWNVNKFYSILFYSILKNRSLVIFREIFIANSVNYTKNALFVRCRNFEVKGGYTPGLRWLKGKVVLVAMNHTVTKSVQMY
jgi:hypothetical protein